MNKISIKISYNRLNGYTNMDFANCLKSSIDEEPNDQAKYKIKYNIEFIDNGCIINAESPYLSHRDLFIYFQADIFCIENKYKYVSNVSVDL